jgi:transglutaminase-like putative cysteine protease
MDSVATMQAQIRGARGERSVMVRQLTGRVVAHLQPKDYLSEIIAVRNFVTEKVRFMNDPLTTEWISDPQRLVEEITARGSTVGDCDDIASLIAAMARQLGREVELVVVGFGAPGQYSHVFTRVKEPKSGRWIVTDPVAGSDEAKMLRRVTTYRRFSVN